ncbi:hypothetical protein B0J14DRAFT_669508 [Halenospora varia]|nr:hypothetical protein B0J14DRAFT_669508 [Halenospora varia]
MDSLLGELIDRICGYLTHDDSGWPTLDELKNTLTVSRQFQFASERACRRFERFSLTDSNAETFLEIYNGHRRYYLRDVEFQTSFPPLVWKNEWSGSRDYPACRDTVNDLRAMDESFSHQVSYLFATLKTMEDRMGKEHTPRRINLMIRTPTRNVNTDSECLHRKYVCWRVHLLSPESLPELFSISSIVLLQDGAGFCRAESNEHTPAKLDLRVLLDLSVKLPHLEYLGCKLLSDDCTTDLGSKSIRHYTRNWEGPHRDTRHDFAKALQDLGSKLPTSLNEVQLDFIDHVTLADGIDQRQPLPNMTKPVLYDLFSSSLRLLSNQLRKLKLGAVVDETLFCSAEGSAPFWPNLESLEIMFHMATPKGNWYFHGVKGDGWTPEGFEITAISYPPVGPNEEDERWDERASWDDPPNWSRPGDLQFRVVPDDEVLLPFLTRFAKATANMPSLKKAALWSPLAFCPGDVNQFYREYDEGEFVSDSQSRLVWGIGLQNCGEKCRPESSLSDSHQTWWKVGRWKPVPNLHHLFQQMGGQNTAGNLVEHWEDEVYGQSLVGREVFDNLAIFLH